MHIMTLFRYILIFHIPTFLYRYIRILNRLCSHFTRPGTDRHTHTEQYVYRYMHLCMYVCIHVYMS
jgi:hypothetical protein